MVSLSLIVSQAAPAFAATSDSDGDGLTNVQERNITLTSPFDRDSDDDRMADRRRRRLCYLRQRCIKLRHGA